MTSPEAPSRLLTEEAPLPMWAAGRQGERTFFNARWLTFTGRDPARELGFGWVEGIHPQDEARVLEVYRSAVLAGEGFELEYRMRHADGTYRWLLDTGIPRFAPGGELTGYVGASLDITERRASRDALRSSRDQFAIILEGAADGITALDPTGRFRYANDAAARMLGHPNAEALMAVPWMEAMARFEVSDESDQLVPPLQMPSLRVIGGEPIASITARLRPLAGGGDRWLTIRATPVFDETGQVELAVTLLHEITQLKHAELSQRILAETGRIMALPMDEASRLQEWAHLIVPILADGCSLEVRTQDGTPQRVVVATNDAARAALAAPIPPSPDPATDSAVSATASNVAIPLLAHGQELGSLSVVPSASRLRYSAADLVLLNELAHRLSLGLDNARLYREAQEHNATLEARVQSRTAQLLEIRSRLEQEISDRNEAQQKLEASRAQLRRLSGHLHKVREGERVRIAREIHDELGQALVGLNMDVAWLSRSLGRRLPAVRDKLSEMTQRILETVRSVRRISSELRPSILDDLGLSAALEWQLEEFQTRTGLECVLESRLTEGRLDSERATAVFRILQEALTNVARHAGASRVNVTIEESPKELTLSIQDNGRGIRPEELTQPNSFGLLGMRERVDLLEGEIEIRGTPGEGTLVRLRLPLAEEAGR